MPISVTCGECGKTLKAKDSAAGKKTKCPDCGAVMVIPAASDDDEFAHMTEDYDAPAIQLPSDADEKRVPCPMCGQMIVAGAAKCRFCGESLKKGRAKSSSSNYDDDMTTSDWIIAILCPGIGCIGGIIYLVQGKKKASKLLLVSIGMIVFWNVIRFGVGMVLNGMK